MSLNKLTRYLVILFMLQVGAARAEDIVAESDAAPSVADVTAGTVSGKISAINKNYIVVVYKTDKEREYEVLLPIDTKETKIKRKKNLSELNIGDTISIEYEDVKESTLEGQRTKRNTKVINFISPAPPKPPESQNWE